MQRGMQASCRRARNLSQLQPVPDRDYVIAIGLPQWPVLQQPLPLHTEHQLATAAAAAYRLLFSGLCSCVCRFQGLRRGRSVCALSFVLSRSSRRSRLRARQKASIVFSKFL